MPELPEVETIRRSLLLKLKNNVFKEVEVFKSEVLINEFSLSLSGCEIKDLRRRGKYLIIDAGNTVSIVIHLRMTGQLLLDEQGDMKRDHVHVKFKLTDKSGNNPFDLLFRDVRRFGRIWYFPQGKETLQQGLASLGPEPLDSEWTFEHFKTALQRHKKANIKNVLLNQHVVAGLGNIYVDESLFLAGISPLRLAASLFDIEISKLHQAVKQVLGSAIGHRGTSFRDYVDGLNTKGHFQYQLKVYGKGGQKCQICGQEITKRKVAGRGTCSCPCCQPDPL